jgi:hypothetical protein
MRRVLCALFICLPLLACGQPASPTVSRADALAIRKVVEAQLDAFRRDDAARAFSYATPGIRELFGSPETFMAMVKSSYPVVYRPRNVAFEEPTMAGSDLVQPVRMIDSDGLAWLALYPMQRGEDSVWRINGCQLGRLAGQEI